MINTKFADELRKCIEVAVKNGPYQVFADAVSDGLIDREGCLTKL